MVRFALAVFRRFIAARVVRGWFGVSLVAIIAVVNVGAASRPGAEISQRRGFTIEEAEVRMAANFAEVRAAAQEQIDIVCSVGLADEVMTFFQRVPLRLIAPGGRRSETPGLYLVRTKTVEMTSRIAATGHKPVLLHELLHAYHDQQIKDGYRNREILAFYVEGQRLNRFAGTSHMLRNEKEYFACAATAYLFGVTAQEPFSREKLKEVQPQFFEYLKRLFGPTTGSFAGSLTR